MEQIKEYCLINKRKLGILLAIIVSFALVIAVALVRNFNPEEVIFIICPINFLTGINCPGCGMTRAMHQLLNGNIEKAIWYNIMIIPTICVGIYGVYRYFCFLINGDKMFNKKLKVVVGIFAVLLIIFAVIRNLTEVIY